MGYARGLIKYSTQNAITNRWSRSQMMQRILRPRVIIYGTILTLLITALLASLWFRTPFRVNVIRDRGVMARLADGGMLENVYRLQIMNGTETTQHYQLNANGIKDLAIEVDGTETNQTISVKPAESRWVSVRLEIPDGSIESGSHRVEFEIKALDNNDSILEKSVFLVPRY